MMPITGVTLLVHAVVILIRSVLTLFGLRPNTNRSIPPHRVVGMLFSGVVIFSIVASIMFSLSWYVNVGLKDDHATWRLTQDAIEKVGLHDPDFFVYQTNTPTKTVKP